MSFSSYKSHSVRIGSPLCEHNQSHVLKYDPLSSTRTTDMNNAESYFTTSCNSRNTVRRLDGMGDPGARLSANLPLTPRASLIERVTRAKEGSRNGKRINLCSGGFKSPRIVKPIPFTKTAIDLGSSMYLTERSQEKHEPKEYYRRRMGSDLLLDNYTKQKLKKASTEKVQKFPLIQPGAKETRNGKRRFMFIRIIGKCCLRANIH
eukprot:TRINITY_DN3787_c0_g1_i8.p1 TRINITY_DN3787_c0_g1~~TRINITY_DN3787_c0_g1_i8.p1  ORF type:complete len:206 (-),score=18.24 TRINITY_DN3787_c0_g1_i8:45-662(-)